MRTHRFILAILFFGLTLNLSRAHAQTIPIAPAAPAPMDAPTAPADVPAASPAPSSDTAPVLSGRIARITLKGLAHITPEAVRAILHQKVGQPYSADAASRDRDAIKGMGYFNGDIGLDAQQTPEGEVALTYTVVENPIIKRIAFVANTPTQEPTIAATKLRSLMDTKEGQVLNTNVLVRDLDRLFNRQTGYARTQGYIIDVSADINIDPNSNVLTIPLVEAHIQNIVITGNKKTKAVVVTRELRSRTGDVFNENKLQKDLTRVYNLGLFDQVGPYEPDPADVGKINIIIPVVEKRSGNVGVSVGYSSRSKIFGRAELAENNFRGMGERVSLSWEVGGISSQSSVDLAFYEPYLDKNHTALDVDVYNRIIYRFSSNTFGGGNGDSSQYSERHQGGTLGLSRQLSDTIVAGITARSESVSVNNFDVNSNDTFIRQSGSVSTLGGRLVSNTRDQDFNPASGGLNQVSAEFGAANTHTVGNSPSPLAPGRHNVSKVGLDLRRYISLQGPRKAGDIRAPRRVFAVRLQLGVANQDVPFFEQYFLGGADSLRGYQTDRYWGNKLLLLQSELRVPVGKGDNFQAVLLGDAGDCWGSIYQGQGLLQHDNLALQGDYGLGIRLVTPIGPIRLDYAIPTGGGAGRTQFSIGQSF